MTTRADAPARTALCVEVTRAQPSTTRGHTAQWTVLAWTTGGSVSDVTVGLQARTGTSAAPYFSFGCAHGNGTASCELGQVDAGSAPRQLQASLTVPVQASRVTTALLTVSAAAPQLAHAATASASVAVTAPVRPKGSPTGNPTHAQIAPVAPASQSPKATKDARPTRDAKAPKVSNSAAAPKTQKAATQPAAQPTPVAAASPLPVGSLPRIPAAHPALRPAVGSAAGLFPTLTPQPRAKSTPMPSRGVKARARTDASNAALAKTTPIAYAQLVGIIVLGLALVFAFARLSIRRHPANRPDQGEEPEKAETPDG